MPRYTKDSVLEILEGDLDAIEEVTS